MIFEGDIILTTDNKKWKSIISTQQLFNKNIKPITDNIPIIENAAGTLHVDNEIATIISPKMFTIEETLQFDDDFINAILERFGCHNHGNYNKNWYEFLHILAYNYRISDEEYKIIVSPHFRCSIWNNPNVKKSKLLNQIYTDIENKILPKDKPECYNNNMDDLIFQIGKTKIFNYSDEQFYEDDKCYKIIDKVVNIMKRNIRTENKFKLAGGSIAKDKDEIVKRAHCINDGKLFIKKIFPYEACNEDKQQKNRRLVSAVKEFVIAKYMGDIGVAPIIYDYTFDKENNFAFYMEAVVPGTTLTEYQCGPDISIKNNEILDNVVTVLTGNMTFDTKVTRRRKYLSHLGLKAMRYGSYPIDRHGGNFLYDFNEGWKLIDFGIGYFNKFNYKLGPYYGIIPETYGSDKDIHVKNIIFNELDVDIPSIFNFMKTVEVNDYKIMYNEEQLNEIRLYTLILHCRKISYVEGINNVLNIYFGYAPYYTFYIINHKELQQQSHLFIVTEYMGQVDYHSISRENLNMLNIIKSIHNRERK